MENTEKKLTAVEWLESKMYVFGINPHAELFKEAKEMEKQQMIDACLAGDGNANADTYYYEAFGKALSNCLNCKFAGESFDLGGIAHVYCKHPDNKEEVDSGELEPLDTLMEGLDVCSMHEFTSQTPDQ